MKIGSKVTPIMLFANKYGIDPKVGEICTIEEIFISENNNLVIRLENYNQISYTTNKRVVYLAKYFREVDTPDPLQEQIEEALKAPVPIKPLIPA